ncbi:hypothetical protein [Paenibacillus durus]|uniref:Uncharacterized protein n=1 Tax=Paenibacillus durus ATCC 35681 TaxID=1333534 RepID=A0A0F7FCK4_PAEDU|nr:hypothetical protein [Paenibacillus durus]AKG36069.1 hypothetical protein VK70_17145 [Paenibacillus durus ATCC 35681]
MKVSYKVLESDADFLAASLTQVRVSVWFRLDPDPIGHLMDYGGAVEEYTTETVKIAGSRFFRHRFEFRAYG